MMLTGETTAACQLQKYHLLNIYKACIIKTSFLGNNHQKQSISLLNSYLQQNTTIYSSILLHSLLHMCILRVIKYKSKWEDMFLSTVDINK